MSPDPRRYQQSESDFRNQDRRRPVIHQNIRDVSPVPYGYASDYTDEDSGFDRTTASYPYANDDMYEDSVAEPRTRQPAPRQTAARRVFESSTHRQPTYQSPSHERQYSTLDPAHREPRYHTTIHQESARSQSSRPDHSQSSFHGRADAEIRKAWNEMDGEARPDTHNALYGKFSGWKSVSSHSVHVVEKRGIRETTKEREMRYSSYT